MWVPERLQQRAAANLQALFKLFGAIAIAAGPGLRPVQVAAVLAGMRILDAEQFEVLLPIWAFFLEGGWAETGFHPVREIVLIDAGVAHVFEVFIASYGALAQALFLDGLEQGTFAPLTNTGFDEITHGER